MDVINTVTDFLYSPTGAAISLALFAGSEALAAIPAVKANGVFQLLFALLGKLVKRPAA